MNCPVSTQIDTYTNSDCQACAEAERNEAAISELFRDNEALFSNGYIDLVDVVEKAIQTDKERTVEVLMNVLTAECKMPETLQEARAIMHERKIAQTLYRNHISPVALGMNEAMRD